MRHVLRPGFTVARRDDAHLQVGLGPAVVLPETAEVRRLVAALADARADWPALDVTAARALDALDEAGLLVDVAFGDSFVAARFGRSAADRLAARSAGVRVDGSPDLVALLGASGVADGDGLVVVVSPGPIPRTRLDGLMRSGTPHLLVEGGPTSWTVGPFVLPGATACARCVDAASPDPRRPVLLEQARPGPVDPVLRSLALAHAAREVVAWLDGDRPTTWSATLQVGDRDDLQAWPRHPHCGCAWDLVLREPGPSPQPA